MSWFRKYLILPISLIVFVGALVLLQRISDSDRVCLQWDGIRELTYRGEKVAACSSTDRLNRAKVSKRLKRWVLRLNRLARLNWLANSHRSIKVEVTSAERAQQNSVPIDPSLADQANHFERTVVLAWLEHNWPEQVEFTREVMADLLSWSLLGDRQWSEPSTGEPVAFNERMKFTLMPRSFHNYCQSPFRSAGDFEFCTEGAPDEMQAELGLRPLVAWTIWNYMRELPASEQVAFFASLMSNHNRVAVPEAAGDLQIWTRQVVQMYLLQWSTGRDINASILKKQLYRAELSEPVIFDVTIQLAEADLNDETFESLKKWVGRSKQKRILFVSGKQKVVLPENLPVDLEKNEIQSQHYVLLACSWPRIQNVLQIKSRLLYAVKVCSGDKLPSWREILHSQATHLGTLRNANLKQVN